MKRFIVVVMFIGFVVAGSQSAMTLPVIEVTSTVYSLTHPPQVVYSKNIVQDARVKKYVKKIKEGKIK